MSTLFSFLKHVLPVIESQRERDEAYLAAATDLNDLERRMRAIDQRGRRGLPGVSVGLYTR
jgi:hypothetical protein